MGRSEALPEPADIIPENRSNDMNGILEKVEIIDAMGNVVALAADYRDMPAGEHNLQWSNNGQLASGTYSVRLTAGSITSTQQMVIVK